MPYRHGATTLNLFPKEMEVCLDKNMLVKLFTSQMLCFSLLNYSHRYVINQSQELKVIPAYHITARSVDLQTRANFTVAAVLLAVILGQKHTQETSFILTEFFYMMVFWEEQEELCTGDGMSRTQHTLR